MPSAVPFVGPAKHECPGAAFCKCCSDLPIQKTRLVLVAVPKTVQSDLGQHQRPVADGILKTRYVCAEGLFVF